MVKQIRTCIISREKLEKNLLIQILFHISWDIHMFFPWVSKEKWRSVYIKNSNDTINNLLKRWNKFLSNFIKRKVSIEQFKELEKKLNNLNKW